MSVACSFWSTASGWGGQMGATTHGDCYVVKLHQGRIAFNPMPEFETSKAGGSSIRRECKARPF